MESLTEPEADEDASCGAVEDGTGVEEASVWTEEVGAGVDEGVGSGLLLGGRDDTSTTTLLLTSGTTTLLLGLSTAGVDDTAGRDDGLTAQVRS